MLAMKLKKLFVVQVSSTRDRPAPLARRSSVLDLTPAPARARSRRSSSRDLGAAGRQDRGHRRGDYLRHMPPPLGRATRRRSFLALNRNKRSIAPRPEEAVGAQGGSARARVERYDVLLEQFRPGVLDRLGLSHATLLRDEPAARRLRAHRLRADGPARAARRARHQLPRARRRPRACRARAGAPPAGARLPARRHRRRAVERHRHPRGAGASATRTGEGARRRRRDGRGVDGLRDRRPRRALRRASACARGDEPLTGGLAGYGDVRDEGRRVRRARRARAEVLDGVLRRRRRSSVDTTALVPGPAPGGAARRSCRASSRRGRATSGRRSRASTTAASSRCSSPTSSRDDAQLAARQAFFEIDSPWGRIPQLRTPLTAARAAHHAPAAAAAGEHTDAILREAGLDDAAIARCGRGRRALSGCLGRAGYILRSSSTNSQSAMSPFFSRIDSSAANIASQRRLLAEDLARVGAVRHGAKRADEVARGELVADLGRRLASGVVWRFRAARAGS